MKIADILNFGFTIICLLLLPSYIGISKGYPLIGIILGGLFAISYLLYFINKKK